MIRGLAVLVMVGCLVTASGAAEMYRWVDRQGNVTFSDRPPQPGEVGPPPPAPGATAPSGAHRDVHPAADQLLELSGIKQQLSGVARETRSQLQQGFGVMDAQDAAAVQRIIGDVFRPEALYTVIREELGRRVDESKIKDVVAWYRSPLGRRITGLEVAFSAAERQRELAEFIAQLRVHQPSAARMALIQQLDAASGTTDLSIDIVVGIAQVIARVADPFLPSEQRLKPGQLESQVRQIRLYVQEPIRQVNTVAMLYMYRSTEDHDLTRYIQFRESEAGSWFGQATRKALVWTLTTAVERTATRLVQVVPPERWAQGDSLKRPAAQAPGQRL